MNLVIVAQVKNLKNAAELYNINAKNKTSIDIETVAIIIFFLELNIS